jgi:hypothetical protein
MSTAETQENDPLDDLVDLEETGEGSTLALVDAFPTIPADADAATAVARIYSFQASVEAGYPVEISDFIDETTNALADSVNDGIVPPGVAGQFWFWLAYNAGIVLIPAAGAYAFIQGYVLRWAQDNGWATYGPNPEPTPAVQGFIESATAAAPFPGTAPAPVDLPFPTQGQQSVVGAVSGITPSTVTGGTAEGTSADQVSAALAVTFVDAMRVMASVFDAFLPGMAPGQVPDALSQLNTAVNALEAQMGQVRAGQWPRGFVGLQEAVGGALQALNGLSQEVGILAQQMAEKADSSLEDGITTNSTAIAGITATVAGVVGTALPELDAAVGTLTGQVGALESQVTNSIGPHLQSLDQSVQAAAAKLALTDDPCLEALCDTVENVSQPIENGGATPSLLKNLGALLGLGWVVSTIFGLMTTAATLLDAPYALAVVAQDTEQLAAWAESAASAIETELPVQ